MRRKAAEFWQKNNTQVYFEMWKTFHRSQKMQNYVRFHFFHTQFTHWAKKSKRRKNARILFQQLGNSYIKNMKKAAMGVWWKGIRKTYRIYEKKIKSSKYRVIVENTGLIFPRETSKSLIEESKLVSKWGSLKSTVLIRPHRKSLDERERKLKELDKRINELKEWKRLKIRADQLIDLDYMPPEYFTNDKRYE